MADARAREQLRQEREAFEQAFRHDKAWFALRLAMGYLGLTIMLAIFVIAMWVLTHPQTYGPLPIGAAALSMTSQALVISYGIVRLVLSQANVDRLEPVTISTSSREWTRVRTKRRTKLPGGAAAGQG